jgi:hypothetical protein
MRPIETIPGMEGGKIKNNDGGANSTKIYYKNFCKCCNVPPAIKKERFRAQRRRGGRGEA